MLFLLARLRETKNHANALFFIEFQKENLIKPS